MASAALVSSITGTCMRRSSSSKTIVDSFGISEGRTASAAGDQGATVSRMEIIRYQFHRKGFSGPLVELLMAGNRTSTHSTYESAWRVWNSWCVRRGEKPLSVPVNSVLKFLTELFNSKKSYSTIKGYRLSRGTLLECTLWWKISSTVAITLIPPPRPRYNPAWDPDIVIKYLSALGNNQFISISALTHKTAVLLAFASLLRVSELASISLISVNFSVKGVFFSLLKPRKAQHSGPLQSIIIPGLPDFTCCPVEAVRAYFDRTSTHRNDTNINSLFISLISPHRNVKAKTISGWIRSSLTAAGVDTTVSRVICININTFLNTWKTKKKLKLSFNNFFSVKIFGKGFNSSFSKQFYILFKKKSQFTRSSRKKPIFPYLSATRSGYEQSEWGYDGQVFQK